MSPSHLGHVVHLLGVLDHVSGLGLQGLGAECDTSVYLRDTGDIKPVSVFGDYFLRQANLEQFAMSATAAPDRIPGTTT